MSHPTAGVRPPRPAHRGRRLFSGLVAGLLGIGLSLGAVPAAHAADDVYFCADSQPYVPVAEVEAFDVGEAVTGLSVTHGTSPDPFTGTYVGYLADALGKGKDLLLFRLSSPVIDGADGIAGAGIWAGMSGSPVYHDGKLVGAVSYSLSPDTLPIAGVTPAEYMKSIGSTAISAAAVRTTSANLTDASRTTAASLKGTTFSPIRTVKVAGAAGTLQNAFANRTLARTPRTAKAASFLRSGGFVAAAAVSDTIPDTLEPGGSIAALYASGDLVTGAVGTVTAVCGNTVWAFGHPMDSIGRTSLLMANASTALIVPDRTGVEGSYKQVSAFGEPIGMITEDRNAGIRGTKGSVSDFPIEVAVQGPTGSLLTTYRTAVADQEMTASAVAYLVGEAASEQLDQIGAGTGEVTWTIAFTRANGDHGELTNSQVVADSDYFPDLIGTPPADDAWTITENDLEDVTITGVQVTLKLLDDDAVSYQASGVQLLSGGTWKSLSGVKLKAGSTVSVRPQYVRYTNDKRGDKVPGDPFDLTLSKSARTSGYLRFAGANSMAADCADDPSGDPDCSDFGDSVDPGDFADFDELLAALDDEQPDTLVTAKLYTKLKKGSSSRYTSWTGPGVVTGRAKVTFKIKA
jgi:hypothetical protein